MSVSSKLSFKQQQLIAREEAIIDAVNRLLSEKGYELMTMDAVSAEVGIAKASLYRHFRSKEALAAAAMIRLLETTLKHVQALRVDLPAIFQLRDILQWALLLRMKGGLPTLPAQNTTLKEALINDPEYVGKLLDLNGILEKLIEQAKRDGAIRANIPSEVVLFSIYARSCDPTADYLKSTGLYSNEQIVELLLSICFDGLS